MNVNTRISTSNHLYLLVPVSYVVALCGNRYRNGGRSGRSAASDEITIRAPAHPKTIAKPSFNRVFDKVDRTLSNAINQIPQRIFLAARGRGPFSVGEVRLVAASTAR